MFTQTAPPSLSRKTCSRQCWTALRLSFVAPTSIELAIYEALDALEIPYEKQHVIGPFVADAWLTGTKIAIECLGDYWHGNPFVYSPETMDAAMKKRRAHDRMKYGYLRKHGYTVIELWEKDIRDVGAIELLKQKGIGVAA